MHDSREPVATFYRFIPQARAPQRADRAAGGTLPTRAFRYCEAVCAASAFGWYVFPPTTLTLMWDGRDILWTYEGGGGWQRLGAAQFPDFSDHFDRMAPDDVRGFAPPFLGALTEPGLIQLWSGLAARTAPGWSLRIRPPANLPRPGGYEAFEGVVDTDTWFGPLFANIRLTRTDYPIEFRADFPFLQVEPVYRAACTDAVLDAFDVVPDLAAMTRADWDRYRDTVVRPSQGERRPGRYAVATRRRRHAPAACPVAHQQDTDR